MTVQEAPTGTRPDTATSCPTCGAPAARGQLICLECGSRITLGYRKPPSWRLPVGIIAAVLVIAGVGLFIGLSAVSDDAKEEVASKPARVQEKASKSGDASGNARKDNSGKANSGAGDNDATKKTKAKKEPSTAKKKPKAKTPKAKEPKPTATAGGIQSWPRDRVGFTVVVMSAEDRPTARKFAASANKRAAKLGVIRSDDFKSLPQGFYIVFSGVYKKRAQADRAAGRLGKRFKGAFPQLVKR
jgi:hypothetical protein